MADINEVISSLSGLARSIGGIDVDSTSGIVSDLQGAFAALGDSERVAGISSVDDDLGKIQSLLAEAAELASNAAGRLQEWA